MTDFENYSDQYKNIRMERRDGILQLSLHHQGGPAIWTARRGDIHAELGDAFYKIGRNPENLVVILSRIGQ
jgi:hypothetical protein